jgi:hypothetical protein
MTDLACLWAVMPACPTHMATAERGRLLCNRRTIAWLWHSPSRISVTEGRSCVLWQQLYRRHLHRQPVTADGRKRYWNINLVPKFRMHAEILWKKVYFWEIYCSVASMNFIILFLRNILQYCTCILYTYRSLTQIEPTIAQTPSKVATQDLTLVVCIGEAMGAHLGQDIDPPD